MKPKDDHDEESEVDFPKPKDYTLPPAAADGKEFTVLATFRVDEDEPDMICLTKIENVPVSAKEDDSDEEDEGPETSPEMMKALQQSEATNASQGMPAASTY